MPRAEINEEKIALLKEFFPSHRGGPKDRNEPATFEIAIMMAGAVSAGAYTAGVMDFLIEALDSWHSAKADDDAAGRTGTDAQRVPHHNVVLRLITGTSAGGMNGAIAAAALDYDFPHIYDAKKYAAVTAGNAHAPAIQNYAANPFYNGWVKLIDIMPMLDTRDIGGGMPHALLNCGVLQTIATQIVQFSGTPAPPKQRAWLLNPYEVRLTVTNLRGVPFAYNLEAEDPKAHQGFLMHADHMAFAVKNTGAGPVEKPRPDCIVLDPGMSRQSGDWKNLGLSGLATGAFPIALASRDLTRNAEQYLWRHSFYDMEANAPVFANPAWPENMGGGAYSFATVDGGVMNNEPFEIARSGLAGPRGENAQGGELADRAIIVIDPFVEDPEQGPSNNANILDAAMGIISSWKNQIRMSMQDLIDIQREDVYSRFMIAPSRQSRDGSSVFGSTALATSELGAFAGFFCEAYRHHDFLLGRRNAQRFLSHIFVIPETNSLFAGGRWTPNNKQDFAGPTAAGIRQLQIIPLCGHLADIEENTPDWPRLAYRSDRDKIALAVSARIRAVLKALGPALANQLAGPVKPGKPGLLQRAGTAISGWFLAAIGRTAGSFLAGKLETAALAKIDAAFAATDARPFK
jgi:hypothetical protein